MSQIKLDAQLSGDLAFILLVPNLLFLHHLHTTEKSCCLVLNQHDLTELALTQLFTNSEIILFKLN